MVSPPKFRAFGSALLACGLTALGWWFGSGLHPSGWLMFLAPLPVLWLATQTRAHNAALVAFIGVAIGGFNLWPYLHRQIGLPLPVIALAITVPALTCAACVALFGALVARGRLLSATLAPSSLWLVLEYVSMLMSPHGTFGAIAYTQMDTLPLLQLAAVTGLWGIDFLVLLVPSSVAATFASTPRRGRWIPLALTCILLAISFGYGAWRLHESASQNMRVGLVSLNRPIRPALASPQGQVLFARYATAITTLADRGAQVVVIPETSFAAADTSLSTLTVLAQQHGLLLDIGIDSRNDPADERNQAMAFLPHSAVPLTYAKHHLIPGLERQYLPGTDQQVFGHDPRIGLAICKDMDFHDTGVALARLRAQLVLVPAWDFGIDGWLHSRMAIMRGVENGFAIARTARDGRLTLSDDRGRVVAESSSEYHDATLLGDLPIYSSQTLYSRWGDWFVWLNLALLVGCAAMLFRRKLPAMQ